MIKRITENIKYIIFAIEYIIFAIAYVSWGISFLMYGYGYLALHQDIHVYPASALILNFLFLIEWDKRLNKQQP